MMSACLYTSFKLIDSKRSKDAIEDKELNEIVNAFEESLFPLNWYYFQNLSFAKGLVGVSRLEIQVDFKLVSSLAKQLKHLMSQSPLLK